MPLQRRAKSASPEKVGSKLRLVGDIELVEVAQKAFSAFPDKDLSERLFPELGFRFIKTPLGMIQVDVGWLLLLIGGIIQRAKPQKEGEPIEVELTEDVIEATVDVVRSIPRHIERVLLGMYCQADFLVRAKHLDNPHIPLERPITTEKFFEFFAGTKEGRRVIGREILGQILAQPSLPDLLMPGFLEALVAAISEQDAAATDRWRKFLDKHFGQARKRGRKREELYDSLFKKRVEDPTLSYGKLALEVARIKNIEFVHAREQVKAAISYRRKKLARRGNPSALSPGS